MAALTSSTSCKKDNASDIRDNFVATYLVTESWKEKGVTQINPSFSMSIEKSAQYNDKLLLNNFGDYGYGNYAEATVNGFDITIPQQKLINTKTIAGSGKLENNTLNIIYTETVGATSLVITVTAQKR